MKAERSRHVVLVTPPDVGRVGSKVWDSLSPTSVVVCADHEQAADWAAAAPAEASLGN